MYYYWRVASIKIHKAQWKFFCIFPDSILHCCLQPNTLIIVPRIMFLIFEYKLCSELYSSQLFSNSVQLMDNPSYPTSSKSLIKYKLLWLLSFLSYFIVVLKQQNSVHDECPTSIYNLRNCYTIAFLLRNTSYCGCCLSWLTL